MKKWLSILWAASMLLCLCACGDDTIKETPAASYPPYMLASFTNLYDRNDEVRGWIIYRATGDEDFLDIEYPIVYSGDNEKYVDLDFDGNKNRDGTLFFDKNNKVDNSNDKNRVLIIHDHGRRFGSLTNLMSNVSKARTAATFTMSTLFREDQYKVFAVVLADASDDKCGYDMWRTEFFSDADFRNHIAGIRDRSVFDYPVDVEATDELLILSTPHSNVRVKNGYLLVVARRVRDGEDATVDTDQIQKNADVIMPYYWYINQNKTPHEYYGHNGLESEPTIGTDTTDTEGTDSTTPTSTEDTSYTTPLTPSSSTMTSNRPTTTETTTTTTAAPEHQHTFDGCEDTTCNTCDDTREVEGHQFIISAIWEPTCSEDGLLKKNCSVCGMLSNEVIPATGEHTYDDEGICTGCYVAKPTDPSEPAEPTEPTE